MAIWNPVSVSETGYQAGTPRNWTQTFVNATGLDRVATPSSLQANLNACNPGDVIRLTNGTYNSTYTANVDGTASEPIIIMAQNPGTHGSRNVTLSGGRLILNGSNYIVGGFRFSWGTAPSNMIQINANNIEFTDVDIRDINTTSGNSRVFVITSNASNCHIHHNYFFTITNPMVIVQDVTYPSPYGTGNIIEYNTLDTCTGGTVGGLWVQLGNEPYSFNGNDDLCNTGTILRYNRIVNCNSAEIKTRGNLVFKNYIANNSGRALSFRSGDYNVFDSNYVSNCYLAMRIFAKNQTIVNNYFEGHTGRATLCVCEGSLYSDMGVNSNAHHERAENILIANNVIVTSRDRGIHLGDTQTGRNGAGRYQPYSPKNIWIYNNIISMSTGVGVFMQTPDTPNSDGYSTSVDSYHRYVNVELRNNVLYMTGTAVVGDNSADGGSPPGYISWSHGTMTTGTIVSLNQETNPLLTATYRLQPTSPCINTGTTYNKNNYNTTTMVDWDGDARIIGSAPDIGVEEFGLNAHLPTQGAVYLFGGQVVTLANPYSNFEIVPGQGALLFNGNAVLKGKDKPVSGPGILYFNGGNTGKVSEPVTGIVYFNGSALRGDFTWRPIDEAQATTWRVV